PERAGRGWTPKSTCSLPSTGRLYDRLVDRWRISIGGHRRILYQRKLLPRRFRLALAVPHTGIEAPFDQKPVVCATLDNDALVEHDDLVGANDGRQPMRDHKR